MPIYIERPQPQTLSAEDLIDLEKIYADYSENEPSNHLKAWQAKQLTDWQLVVARFNDRLLGALWLHTEADHQLIHHLCVRKITRGRGVGRRLIDQTVKASEAQQHTIALGHLPENDEHRAIVEHLMNNISPYDSAY